MPKFYVESGSLKEVVVADDCLNACVAALQAYSSRTDECCPLEHQFIVNERGFTADREIDEEDQSVDLSVLIEKFEIE
tara:strand:- start:227 stop:460 length:234 start_codon:yes stop_codon:yes gene_type:complete